MLILFLGTWCYDSHETELGDKKNHEDKEKSRTPAYDIVSDHYTGIYGSDPGREFAADPEAEDGVPFLIRYLLRHQQSV